MALKKEMTVESGLTVSYWRITGFDLDNIRKEANIIVSPYISMETRLSGATPVKEYTRKFIARDDEFDQNLSSDILEQYSSNIYEYLYNYIKTTPFFKGAEDV